MTKKVNISEALLKEGNVMECLRFAYFANPEKFRDAIAGQYGIIVTKREDLEHVYDLHLQSKLNVFSILDKIRLSKKEINSSINFI